MISLDPTSIAAGATVVLVGVTTYYAVVTSRILDATTTHNFTASFLQLLEAHRKVASSQIVQTASDTYLGQEAFRYASGEILGGYSNELQRGPVDDPKALINSLYTQACHTSSSDFSSYFRTLFYLLSFIRDSGMSTRAKSGYAAFVRARMSTAELELCLSNALSEVGENGFAKLASELHLFMGMRLDHAITESMMVMFRRVAALRAA